MVIAPFRSTRGLAKSPDMADVLEQTNANSKKDENAFILVEGLASLTITSKGHTETKPVPADSASKEKADPKVTKTTEDNGVTEKDQKAINEVGTETTTPNTASPTTAAPGMNEPNDETPPAASPKQRRERFYAVWATCLLYTSPSPRD